MLIIDTNPAVIITRDPNRPSGLIFQMDRPFARPHQALMTGIRDVLQADQPDNFGLFLYILFRYGKVAEVEILAADRFRVVPVDGLETTTMSTVQEALREPYDPLNFTFTGPSDDLS